MYYYAQIQEPQQMPLKQERSHKKKKKRYVLKVYF